MTLPLSIDIRKGNDVTRTEGVAGVTLVLQTPLPQEFLDGDLNALVDMPSISLRCDDNAQLAVLLGALMGATMHLAPDAMPMACMVAAMTDSKNPIYRREL